jgi:aryl-alcohol dehydrogenase-like predicted oxidoreductase
MHVIVCACHRVCLPSVTLAGGSSDEQVADECMTVALKNGVNFFDNAEAYSAGRAEIVFGKVFQRWFTEGLMCTFSADAT